MDPITLTDEAVAAIKDKVAGRSGARGLRLTIKNTGCSGYAYKMDFATEENLEADDKIEKNGAVIYVPKIHSWMLFGMEIGYQETMMETGFTFTNPNESGRCGCGESFSIDRETADTHKH